MQMFTDAAQKSDVHFFQQQWEQRVGLKFSFKMKEPNEDITLYTNTDFVENGPRKVTMQSGRKKMSFEVTLGFKFQFCYLLLYDPRKISLSLSVSFIYNMQVVMRYK